jgi:hypothetical protein
VTSRKLIESIFILIESTMREPEENTSNKGDDGEDGIVPRQERISGQGNEAFTDGVGDSSLEQCEGLDEGSHILRRLRESIFERGDGCQDLRDGDEDVGAALYPVERQSDTLINSRTNLLNIPDR